MLGFGCRVDFGTFWHDNMLILTVLRPTYAGFGTFFKDICRMFLSKLSYMETTSGGLSEFIDKRLFCIKRINYMAKKPIACANFNSYLIFNSDLLLHLITYILTFNPILTSLLVGIQTMNAIYTS